MSSPAVAQGFFAPGFDHELLPQTPPTSNGTVLNDYLQPFQGTGFVPPPTPPPVGTTVLQPNTSLAANGNFYWGQGVDYFGGPAMQRRHFSAIHMALIPKGPNQGRVLVWGAWLPVLLTPSTSLTQTPQPQQWFCQAWSIIDPVNPAQRFRNYLLPLDSTNIPVPTSQPVLAHDLFCCGQAWSQEGDLVVAGGGSSELDITTLPPTATHMVPGGAKYFFVFNPVRDTQPFPGQSIGSHLYPLGSHFGFWQRQPDLLLDRFYPTITLSQQITRSNPQGGSLQNSEVVIVSGGSRPDPQNPAFGDPNQMPQRTYESYGIVAANPPALATFHDPDPYPFDIILGPDQVFPNFGNLYFDEYPRLHVVRSGAMFRSGPAAEIASTDLQTQTQLQSVGIGGYAQLPGRPWAVTTNNLANSPWPFERVDGASLLACFPAADVVIRLGGAKPNGSAIPIPTDTAELYVFPTAGAPIDWAPLPVPAGTSPTIPGTGGRQYLNAVLLPDASVFVIGGGTAGDQNNPPVFQMKTAIYQSSQGWVIGPPSPTRRHYHTTAMLLPDATVLIGGGEIDTPESGTEHDYDIYVPHYLKGNPTRPSFLDLRDSNSTIIPVDPAKSAHPVTRGPTFGVRYTNIGAMDAVAKLVLMAPGAITHHSDMSARLVQLDMGPINGANNDMWFVIPNDGRVPRGYYMLFALNNSGVPSVAEWLKVE